MTWRSNAACRGLDPELFFPDREDGGERFHALKVCEGCPVVDPCRQYALDAHEDAGIWGGTTGRERRKIRRRRVA